jgi:hypothetical protein
VPVDVAGEWIGTWRLDVEEEAEVGPDLAARGGSLRLSLLQFGSAVTGSAEFTGLLGVSSSPPAPKRPVSPAGSPPT